MSDAKSHISEEERLLHFAGDGNVDAFKLSVQSYFSLKSGTIDWSTVVHEKSGNSIMHVASRSGSSEILKFLKANEAQYGKVNFELPNLEGKCPLHEAAQAGQLSCLQFLLELGVAVDPLKRADWTPLMLACTKKHLPTIQTLIEAGAKLHLRNKDGWTAFHIACREGNAEVINYILDCDSTVWKTVSKNGRTPLHTAALHGHLEVVKILLSRGDYSPDQQDSCGSTALMDAARAGQVEIMDVLIEKHKADVSKTDMLGRNCLHLAAQAGRRSSIFYLIQQKGMDANCCTATAHTALHFAAKENQEDTLILLVQLGANQSLKDNKGRTPLDVAEGAKYWKCVEALTLMSISNVTTRKSCCY